MKHAILFTVIVRPNLILQYIKHSAVNLKSSPKSGTACRYQCHNIININLAQKTYQNVKLF